jgi:membrane-bound lytic murein transglycosylase A
MKIFKRTSFIVGLVVVLLLLRLIWTYHQLHQITSKPAPVNLKIVHYQSLPGWNQGVGLRDSLKTFQVSCRLILKRLPQADVGNDVLVMKAEDWFDVCREAMSLSDASDDRIKAFFEQAFIPVMWEPVQSNEGLFTGYYSPLFEGSLHQSSDYPTPLYAVPDDLVVVQLRQFDPQLPARRLVGRVQAHYLKPYHTRREINQGVLNSKAKVLAWMKNEVDRLFLEIQGAGTIKLKQGGELVLGYAGENGAPYHSVAQSLINRGVMTRDSASMQAIRRYIKNHPEQGREAMNENPSFVFFDVLAQSYTPGTQGLPLTPGFSMAVDQKWVPLGVPLWLKTQRPDPKNNQKRIDFERLMIAQDTGGAIRGKVRGDVFWGSGQEAGRIAGGMKYAGMYWLLLPKPWVLAYMKTREQEQRPVKS